jgi:hypothetical protein
MFAIVSHLIARIFSDGFRPQMIVLTFSLVPACPLMGLSIHSEMFKLMSLLHVKIFNIYHK